MGRRRRWDMSGWALAIGLICLGALGGLGITLLSGRIHRAPRARPRAALPHSRHHSSDALPGHCTSAAPATSSGGGPATVNALGDAVGAQHLGTAAYPVPSGAVFVSPDGNDAASGAASAPLRSVQRAVDTARSGSTIVLRAGTYREMVDLGPTKAVTIQPYPGEAVWFSGSVPVTDWIADGNGWRKDGWTARFDHEGLDPALLVGTDPAAGYPDMVFLDDQPLRQVAARLDVVAGTFYVDESANQLFIGNDPQGHSLEASVLPEALNVQASGSVIRGIGFMHYATPISHGGAVRGWQGVLFENDVFTRNAAAGLTLHGAVTVRRVTSTFNGQLGIHGHLAHGARIENSVASWNNTSRFNPEYAAGGMKLTMSTNVTVQRNVADDNYGHGLWLDEHSDHATIVSNITRRNELGAGIMFELSDEAIIAGNISTDNEAGLQAGESSNVDVWNNTLVNNQYAFSAYQDARPRQTVRITVRNNILSAGPASRRPMLINEDFTHTRTWSAMGWTSDFNAFYRPCTSFTPDLTTLANWPAGNVTYSKLRDIAKASSQEVHSLAYDDVPTDPFVADAAHGDYRPPTGSPVTGAGERWPVAVADALGLAAGRSVDIGAPVG